MRKAAVMMITLAESYLLLSSHCCVLNTVPSTLFVFPLSSSQPPYEVVTFQGRDTEPREVELQVPVTQLANARAGSQPRLAPRAAPRNPQGSVHRRLTGTEKHSLS